MPVTLEQHLDLLKVKELKFESYINNCNGKLVQLDNILPARNIKREKERITQYLDSLCENYKKTVEEIAKQLPIMNSECRLSVLIPARYEVNTLPIILNLLLNQHLNNYQLLSHEKYEVVIINNYYEDEIMDDSEEIFNLWKKSNFPRSENFHFITKIYTRDEQYPLTMTRRFLADSTLLRAIQRKEYSEPLYLAPEDADTVWMDSYQIKICIDTLDRNHELDAIRGQQDRCPWVLSQNDLLITMRRSWNFTEAYLARRSLWPDQNRNYNYNWNRIVTGGWNTAFTAEIYSQIGGYTPERFVGEDVDIGEKISCIRGRYVNDEFIPQVATIGAIWTRSEGSARRWTLNVARNIDPYSRKNSYNNFFNTEYEKIYKNVTEQDILKEAVFCSRINKENVNLFEEVLEKDWKFTMEMRKIEEDALKQYKTVLSFLGFQDADVSIDGDRLKIHNINNYKQKLNSYRCMNMREFPGDELVNTKKRVTWKNYSEKRLEL
ncbi:hypothetical protein [Anaerocolumna chitinilytica]|uniref:Uncharacterized protein n=1 Tax=Anaerocolumna chitinilytica TaxID=1727145 RepID=A0A7M3SA75_9FIRM|nr:hypothetical protein [Anaerocolumna chitinilytica]BCK01493.1 hypothetical protein bsdcttw_45330 [Anaerocolumna chitinilytica]